MAFKLEDIEIDEVSLVEAGANKKKFLFRKADEIKGTLKSGYLICPDCGHKEAITDFLKNAGEECPECGTDLIESDAELFSKGDNNMDDFAELIQEFIGEDEIEESVLEKIKKTAKKIPEEVIKALKSSLNILNKYKGLMPDDVKKAIDVLAKAAAGAYGAPAKKEEDINKTGAKLSKATLDIIKKIIESSEGHFKGIQSLKALLKNSLKKGEGVEELEEKVDELIKKLDKLEKGEDTDEDEDIETDEDTDEDEEKKKEKDKKTPLTKKISDKLDEISKRLEKVEKQKGVKKSLTGDDEDEEIDEDTEEDTEDVKKGKTKKHQWGFTVARKREK